jgi:hypothetical protein
VKDWERRVFALLRRVFALQRRVFALVYYAIDALIWNTYYKSLSTFEILYTLSCLIRMLLYLDQI